MTENGLDISGFGASYNLTYPQTITQPRSESSGGTLRTYQGWASPWLFGLNVGPMVMMIENHRSGLLWQIMKKSEYLKVGLRKAGFEGGWLDEV